MQKWEYLFLLYNWTGKEATVNGDPKRKLRLTREEFFALCNKYGSAGWELVGFTGTEAAFKRLKE